MEEKREVEKREAEIGEQSETEKSDREVKQKQARRVEWAETALAPEKGGDLRQWGGPAQASSTRRAPQLTITKTATSTSPLPGFRTGTILR